MKDRQSLIAEFEMLLPLATEWATQEEQQILREGVPLPAHPQLRAAAETVHFLTPETRGLTLQYGILGRWDCWRDRALIAHELVHTAQYEQRGGIHPFLRDYLLECLTIGYANAPMEQEAVATADRVCTS
ncbi:MAG: hypothetical protein ABJB69_08470 [Spartobacteria bacterium]